MKNAGFELKKAKTTVRNDGFVYAASTMLKQSNKFAFGREKPSMPINILGKFLQLLGWFKLGTNPKLGGELFIMGVKPK